MVTRLGESGTFYHTRVVVVHSCLQLRLIRHEWGASFFNVGASLKNCSRRLQRIKPCGSFGPKADKLLTSLDSFLPHNMYAGTYACTHTHTHIERERERERERESSKLAKKVVFNAQYS